MLPTLPVLFCRAVLAFAARHGKSGLTALGLLLWIFAQAQDPSFSQFYANRAYLNPALTGIQEGSSIALASRMQWVSIDKGFRTYDFALEQRIPFLGVGLGFQFTRDEELFAGFNTQRLGFLFSYTIGGRHHNLHFGLRPGLVQQSIDWDKLVFSGQLDPIYGLISGQLLTPATDKVSYGDLDFGMAWRWDMGSRNQERGLLVGMAFHHLPWLLSRSAEGNSSFLNGEAPPAPRITLHAAMRLPASFFKSGRRGVLFWMPVFKWDIQSYRPLHLNESIMVTTAGVNLFVAQFYCGAMYQNRFVAPNVRHTDALIFTVGGYKVGKGSEAEPRFFLGLSVDLNLSGLSLSSGQVYELQMRYVFDGLPGLAGKRKKNQYLKCPTFGL